MNTIHRHKVFVSYHHANDQWYRDRFEQLFANQSGIMVSKSVQIGDIPDNLMTETIRQKIRDEYIRDSTVAVVLIGTHTWQRKHVDWEIAASIRDTKSNPRNGLLGIILPSRRDIHCQNRDIYTIPPRLVDNVKVRFAEIYDWSESATLVESWIHKAFKVRNEILPDNSRENFSHNRTTDKWQ